jgi:hypothetical protein
MTKPASRTARTTWSLLPLLPILAACASIDSRLYEPGSPPRLRDGTISMRTNWAGARDDRVDIRRIKARDGVVTCEFQGHDRGHFTGQVPLERWEGIWRRFLALEPFDKRPYGVDPDDPQGGPYHLIRLELGSRGHEFSAQLRQNILIFASRDVSERLALAGLVVDLVSEFATTPIQAAAPAP